MTDIVSAHPDDLTDDDLTDMRYTWTRGRTAAANAAAQHREDMAVLTTLRRRPRVALPSPNPADWWDQPAPPSFDFALPAPAELLDPLIAHYQLLAYRYEQAVRDFDIALADLDTPTGGRDPDPQG